ncbi:MAG: hypothetical protein A3I24_00110 [Candidatus Harrisonbacteria bacterium RIFCSPLOWO2_02_FULL_41_13b]|uniref:Nudix hydrolase domain-containing protein n=1 Tax=Candidatus Harrisonbacteria bacterium RIFCSPLOWO2_02_FULL_41_13b TaxID=1798409 RepID=A0A1G1ZSN9_9BACT|nr:MAG: hypothetical protein A3I24_00110 [Candidatus Harrisonbacteria bacterium RIFCSPLOWO2_02_FULL_41_13b]
MKAKPRIFEVARSKPRFDLGRWQMAKVCDHTSVGLLLSYQNNNDWQLRFLMIERHNYPQAIALPAGHCDGDDFYKAIRREGKEEVGIDLGNLNLNFVARIDNPCKRQDGSHHIWGIFEGYFYSGTVAAGSDAKRFFWATLDELRKFSQRTEFFMKKYSVDWQDVGKLTKAIFGDPQNPQVDPDWQKEMGLEPVWYYILKKLMYI